MEELTPWFEPTEKPVRPGFYQREWQDQVSRNACDWWDGADWKYGPDEAYPAPNNKRWRGLTAPAE